MSSLPPPSSPDDPLARAEAAFRRTPVPDGPSPEVIARTLTALTAKTKQQTTPWIRRKTVIVTLRIAAAAIVAVGGFAYLALHPSAEATEFAADGPKTSRST